MSLEWPDLNNQNKMSQELRDKLHEYDKVVTKVDALLDKNTTWSTLRALYLSRRMTALYKVVMAGLQEYYGVPVLLHLQAKPGEVWRLRYCGVEVTAVMMEDSKTFVLRTEPFMNVNISKYSTMITEGERIEQA